MRWTAASNPILVCSLSVGKRGGSGRGGRAALPTPVVVTLRRCRVEDWMDERQDQRHPLSVSLSWRPHPISFPRFYEGFSVSSIPAFSRMGGHRVGHVHLIQKDSHQRLSSTAWYCPRKDTRISVWKTWVEVGAWAMDH